MPYSATRQVQGQAVILPGPVRWYGGKGKLARKLLPLIQRTRVYVEPYGVAAWVQNFKTQWAAWTVAAGRE